MCEGNNERYNKLDVRTNELGEVHNITTTEYSSNTTPGKLPDSDPTQYGQAFLTGVKYRGSIPIMLLPWPYPGAAASCNDWFRDSSNCSGLRLTDVDLCGQLMYVAVPGESGDDRRAIIINGGNYNGAIFEGMNWTGINFSNGDSSGCSCGLGYGACCCRGPLGNRVCDSAWSQSQCDNESGSTWCKPLLPMRGANFKSNQVQEVPMKIMNTDLTDADFSGSLIMIGMTGTPERFIKNIFSNSILINVNFSNVDWGQQQFPSLPLPFQPTRFEYSNLTGAIFDEKVVNELEFNHIEWHNVICPDGKNSKDYGDTCKGHLTPKPPSG